MLGLLPETENVPRSRRRSPSRWSPAGRPAPSRAAAPPPPRRLAAGGRPAAPLHPDGRAARRPGGHRAARHAARGDAIPAARGEVTTVAARREPHASRSRHCGALTLMRPSPAWRPPVRPRVGMPPRRWISPASPPTAGACARISVRRAARHARRRAGVHRRCGGARRRRGAGPQGTAWPAGVPPRPLILPTPSRAARWRRSPPRWPGAQPDTVVAVTGTNGKTSTVEFLRQLWTLAGHKAASLGTLGLHRARFRRRTRPDHARSGGAGRRRWRALARAGVQHAAMEASSHGLDQFRLDGVRLAAGGVHQPDPRPSGLPRHHGGLPRGQAAAVRRRCCRQGAPAVASADAGRRHAGALRDIAARRRLDLRTVGEGGSRDPAAAARRRCRTGRCWTSRPAAAPRGVLPLPGRFQADNALLAAALAEATGRDRRAASTCAAAGRRARADGTRRHGCRTAPRPMSITPTRRMRWSGC